MYRKKSAKPAIITVLIMSSIVICVALVFTAYINNEIDLYNDSKAQINAIFEDYVPQPFINNAAYRTEYIPQTSRNDALYYFDAPEGFTIISHSRAWNYEMLELLYEELKLNTHGSEIEKLNEIIVYPNEDDTMNALATYSPGIASVGFHLRYPAFPDQFSIEFPIYTGRINIYGGDTKTTIESIAGGLSHEYGHHYTFYYMFSSEMRRLGILNESQYGQLRDADYYGLIGTVENDENYMKLRHKYLIEVAAEDYVTLMGSPTTRQIEEYYDVKQVLENPDIPRTRTGQRNAFPQENMMLPLGINVPGLAEYFYSFIDAEIPVPIEYEQEMKIEIKRDSVTHRLETGPRTYTHYTVSWNMPYQNTVYTLICYEPLDYSGRGTPIKTVHSTTRLGKASAIVGEYVVVRGNMVHSLDDEITQGVKVFIVTAQLPDGTYYMSQPYEANFN